MSDQDQPVESTWVIEPPGPKEIRVAIAIGDEADLTPEAQSAVEGLIELLMQSEVEAYGTPDPGCGNTLDSCSSYSCPSKGKCKPVIKIACKVHVSCSIG